jgi:hypothetical protein
MSQKLVQTATLKAVSKGHRDPFDPEKHAGAGQTLRQALELHYADGGMCLARLEELFPRDGFDAVQFRSLHDTTDEDYIKLKESMRTGMENKPVYFLVRREDQQVVVIEGRHRIKARYELNDEYDKIKAAGGEPPFERLDVICVLKLHSDMSEYHQSAFARFSNAVNAAAVRDTHFDDFLKGFNHACNALGLTGSGFERLKKFAEEPDFADKLKQAEDIINGFEKQPLFARPDFRAWSVRMLLHMNEEMFNIWEYVR